MPRPVGGRPLGELLATVFVVSCSRSCGQAQTDPAEGTTLPAGSRSNIGLSSRRKLPTSSASVGGRVSPFIAQNASTAISSVSRSVAQAAAPASWTAVIPTSTGSTIGSMIGSMIELSSSDADPEPEPPSEPQAASESVARVPATPTRMMRVSLPC